MNTENQIETDSGKAPSKTPMNGEALLSKWWQSESCQEAFGRANKVKAEKLARLKETMDAKREQLKRDVEQWEAAQ